MSAPYRVALPGLDQIAQVPEIHPTYFQYKKPPNAPRAMPMAAMITVRFSNMFLKS